MLDEKRLRLEAAERYEGLRRRAQLAELWARVRGRPARLLRPEEVDDGLMTRTRHDAGVQQVPIDAIVGSLGRAYDFTPAFLPRAGANGERWIQLYTALHSLAGFPEVELIRVGDRYIVADGHHRISVARAAGLTHIPAHVTEVAAAPAPDNPDTCLTNACAPVGASTCTTGGQDYLGLEPPCTTACAC